MSHGYVERERDREKKREKRNGWPEKTGAGNSVVPDDQDETWYVQVQPEIRKKMLSCKSLDC